MTLPLGSAVHHQAFDDGASIDPSLLELPCRREMTRNGAAPGFTGQHPVDDLTSFILSLPHDVQSLPSTHTFVVPDADATKSPGTHSHHQSSGRSEDAGSPFSQVVYTPNSSIHDYDVSINESSDAVFGGDDDSARSPVTDSYLSSTPDSSFLMVHYPESAETLSTARPVSLISARPQPSTSGAPTQPSSAPSVATPSPPIHPSSAQWHSSFATPDLVMGDDQTHIPHEAFGTHDGFFYGATSFTAPDSEARQHSFYRDQDTFDAVPAHTLSNGAHTTRPMFNAFAYAPDPSFHPPVAPAQHLRRQQDYFATQFQQSQDLYLQTHQQPIALDGSTQLTDPAASSLALDQPASISSVPCGLIHPGNMPIRSQPCRVVVHQPAATARTAPYPRLQTQSSNRIPAYLHPQQYRQPRSFASGTRPAAPARRAHLAPREDQRTVVPSNAPATLVHATNSRKGGRARHMRLPDEVRQQSHKMRQNGACWRCALQRDKCDGGETCRRCLARSLRGQRDLFGCDRSKLPDWVDDLLPLSMTDMHSRPSIEKFVTEQVTRWNASNSIDIYLTSGYGPPLIWRCCEFQPKDPDVLSQLQYLQEANTGIQQRYTKYSPPFALQKLDERDDARFQKYLDEELMHPDTLETLGYVFYGEECMVDPGCFQAELLGHMCGLLRQTRDVQLREVLQDITRMLIITYIMGHTLTIAEDTLRTVLASVRFTPKTMRLEQHVSPRLANRQLKYYFSSLRNNLYVKVLHRQQQTFHDSKKEKHWLVSFCAMLGFAMVLEEIQRTIQIQADAKATKGEMTEAQANAEALNHCQRIDARFELLTLLFQKKYRDKTWTDGSFGPGTPAYPTVAESTFLACVHELLVQRQRHLRSRENIPLGPDHQCKYTTRLVAKFLLPFLNLPS